MIGLGEILAAARSALSGAQWFHKRRTQAARVIAQLNAADRYVIKKEALVGSLPRATPTSVRRFTSPGPHPGQYGALTNEDANRAFSHLQELGVIRPVRFNDGQVEIEYEWTDLGREIRDQLERQS